MKLKCREVKFAADAKGAARYREGRASSGNVKQDTRLCGSQSAGSSRFLKANTRQQRPGCNVEPAAVLREALRQKCRSLAVANVPRVCILDPDWENPGWENTEDR
jgi:hypothetical protein